MTILIGDCRGRLRDLADDSIDSVVTDPPYELGFMGKGWDKSGIANDPAMWAEVLRVLKPGGYLLSFGGTRTYHRMACAVEDAGFIIRDSLSWLYGSGFPKSLNVSKAIDAAAGATREVIGPNRFAVDTGKANLNTYGAASRPDETASATDLARQWEGFGTALKPACEPIVLAQKPLDGTYAQNLAKWGVGALNIDGCRIGTEKRYNPPAVFPAGGNSLNMSVVGMPQDAEGTTAFGRWPANVLLDDAAAAELDRQSGVSKSNASGYNFGASGQDNPARVVTNIKSGVHFADSGGASRFFYVAKASRKERDQGCEHLPARTGGEATDRQEGTAGLDNPRAGAGRTGGAKNYHPTVKPVQLMRYLCRLVTPPGGTVLDPFTGSGTTGVAALSEGFQFTGIELSDEYAVIARARMAAVGQLSLV